jgi:putative transposase
MRTKSLRGEHVTEAMARLMAQRGRSAAIKVDNGSEFAGKVKRPGKLGGSLF